MISIFIFVSVLLVLVLSVSYLLFRIIFYAPARNQKDPDFIDLPQGKVYEPFHEQMRAWVMETRNTSHKVFSIRSFDGLMLYGNYYEYAPGAPIELMFHGYRGSAERDLSGGMHRCFQLGHSALIIDQRCSGKSEGNVITFGILEHRDCLAWIDFAVAHFGPDCKLILTGISMGASTVLMAGGNHLSQNVIGILADCGFHSAKDVIISVAEGMHLPAKLLYPFVKLGAKLYGHFNLEELTAEEAVAHCMVPVLFFHGVDDDYVPSHMSERNYTSCVSRKKLVFIPGAGHGLSYPVSPDRYITEMKSFFYT